MLVSDLVRPGIRYAMAQETSSVPYMVGITGPERNSRMPLFLIDTRKEIILTYEYNSSRRTLDLVRVRTYLYDRQLEDYTNPEHAGGPSVSDVRRELRKSSSR